ncbi:1364_t:CDS:2, partial [Acaulospora morrowiae]
HAQVRKRLKGEEENLMVTGYEFLMPLDPRSGNFCATQDYYYPSHFGVGAHSLMNAAHATHPRECLSFRDITRTWSSAIIFRPGGPTDVAKSAYSQFHGRNKKPQDVWGGWFVWVVSTVNESDPSFE